MMDKNKQLILIPARMASTRLPGKPLADIAGLPMIIQVWKRAMEAEIGRVVIACDDEAIEAVAKSHGAEVVMTAKTHESGSDRIWEALQKVDPDGGIETIINVQGDLPTIDKATIRASLAPLENQSVDISTLATVITNEEERHNPNVVKLVGSTRGTIEGNDILRALYFTRATAPTGEGPLYHHIGLYAYRRSALEKFVSMAPSPLELREKLEQLRALEADMRIDAAIVDTVPLGVDTQEDLVRAREILSL